MKLAPNAKHGMTGTPVWMAWHNMVNRCNIPTHQSYHKYGARGIKVCDRWLGKEGFANFYADMGNKPTPKHTLDRLNNEADYTPENCHWATPYQQTHNRRQTKAYRRKGANKYMGVIRRANSRFDVFTRVPLTYKHMYICGFSDELEAAYVRDQVVLQLRDGQRSEFNVIDTPPTTSTPQSNKEDK